MNPLVSIITPSYNSGRFLKAYFTSILKQDYQNYEIIFINDGSTDNTEIIVSEFKKKFEEKNIRFIYLKQDNGGQAKAMNLGFPYIKGKYFIWPDSDDELYKDNISMKVKYMEKHPEYALAMSAADYLDEKGKKLKYLERVPQDKDNFFEDLLLSKNVVFCPGIYIMRTEKFFNCISNKKINESRIGQNYQILLPVVYREKYGYIKKSLYKYVLHSSSHSNKDNNSYEKILKRFQSHEETLYILLNEICDTKDKEIYHKKVYEHFNKYYLRLANKYGKREELKKYYKKLKNSNVNGIKEKIYYTLGLIGIKKR